MPIPIPIGPPRGPYPPVPVHRGVPFPLHHAAMFVAQHGHHVLTLLSLHR